ncbi:MULTISPECIES: Bbp19 family protein [unclassified Vibrio]|uniref:Bbp19 family protein n=1 Tax=unclassified Vibrio TaxID=2614977 RepID=UPI001361E7CC|nr:MULTISPECIES: hypothetical protein [unclassified Vibrio]NAW60061.1 hypothetical protein [Vibrio sp. V36_P2S2PM302]NAX25982.1 hypothetical protein [Vibrio sp. V38_P2S17PM301]NAX30660.1 hypothetical protein [Vibrio sp. V37_P2S8PM304]
MEYDPFDIESQVEQDLEEEGDEKRRQEAERLTKRYYMDMRSVLDTAHGRNVLWCLLEKYGVMRETFCGENTHSAAYNQGKSAAGRELLNDILTADGDAYIKMMQEHREPKEAE